MKPTIVYAEFECEDACRTRGICVHFSFVLGCRETPDGLICQVCMERGKERAVHASRVCPRHNNRRLSLFTMNLPEDILATEAQSIQAHEILTRSLNCDWGGVPHKAVKRHESSPPCQGDVGAQIPDVEVCIAQDSSVRPAIESDHEQVEPQAKKIKLDEDEVEVQQGENLSDKENESRTARKAAHEDIMSDDRFSAELRAFMAREDGTDDGFGGMLGSGQCDSKALVSP